MPHTCCTLQGTLCPLQGITDHRNRRDRESASKLLSCLFLDYPTLTSLWITEIFLEVRLGNSTKVSISSNHCYMAKIPTHSKYLFTSAYFSCYHHHYFKLPDSRQSTSDTCRSLSSQTFDTTNGSSPFPDATLLVCEWKGAAIPDSFREDKRDWDVEIWDLVMVHMRRTQRVCAMIKIGQEVM